MGIFDVIRFKKGSSLSISILQHGLQEYTLLRENRNNEYSSCHFFNFYFEPKIQSGCMIVTCTVKIVIFTSFSLSFVLYTLWNLNIGYLIIFMKIDAPTWKLISYFCYVKNQMKIHKMWILFCITLHCWNGVFFFFL